MGSKKLVQKIEQERFWIIALLCALCFAILFIPIVYLGPIGGSSEAREVHVAWIIFFKNEWILPLRNGLIPSKPPLFHWLVALAARGVGGFSIELARFISVLAGALVVFCSAWFAAILGKRICPSEPLAGQSIGILSAILLVITYGFNVQAPTATVDMLLAALVTAAVTPVLGSAVIRFGDFDRDPVSNRAFALFFILSGFGVLAKGPLGFVLPSIIIFAALVTLYGFSRALRLCFIPRLAWIATACIGGAWYYLAAKSGGGAFIERQILFENVKRLFGGEFVNAQPWWFYGPELVLAGLPTVLFFLCGTIGSVRENLQLDKSLPMELQQRSRLKLMPIVWVFVGVILFSLATGKRRSYLLPLYPGMAIGAALYLYTYYQYGSEILRQRIGAIASALVTGMAVLLLVTVITGELMLSKLDVHLLSGMQASLYSWLLTVQIPVFGILLTLCAWMLWHWVRHSSRSSRLITLGVAFVGLFGFGVHAGIGFKNYLRNFEPFARQMNAALPANATVGVLRTRADEYFDPTLYYLKREVILIDPATLGSTTRLPSYVLARLSDRSALEHSCDCKIKELVVGNQIPDTLRGSTQRAIALFEMTAGKSP